LTAVGCRCSHPGSARPSIDEHPNMKRFRGELMSTYCRLEIPTVVIIPVYNKHVTKLANFDFHSYVEIGKVVFVIRSHTDATATLSCAASFAFEGI
jgi:hypothetical protein